MKSVHLVIATGQTQANLIPLLQLKPDVIVLAVSEDMENTANEFEQLLKRTTPETLIKIVHNVPSVGLAAIEAKAVEIENELQSEFPDSVLTYHATGGTKLMTLGFYTAFAKQNHRIIYTDTAHNQIEIVYPRGQAAIAIEYTLDVRTYLRSLGFTFQNSMSDNAGWTTPAQKRQQLSQWLAENSQSLDAFLGKMNKLASNALNAKENSVVEPNHVLDLDFANEYREALAKLSAADIFQWNKSAPNKISFKTANNTKYIKGFWLEEYVWLMAQNLGLSEVKANITFGRGQEATKNEMDCIAVHNNRLLAIECKTVALEKKDTKDTNQILYKLEALGKGIGGLYHEKWLVSARPVPTEVEQRAKNAQIKIITPEELPHLKTYLENWRDAKR